MISLSRYLRQPFIQYFATGATDADVPIATGEPLRSSYALERGQRGLKQEPVSALQRQEERDFHQEPSHEHVSLAGPKSVQSSSNQGSGKCLLFGTMMCQLEIKGSISL